MKDEGHRERAQEIKASIDQLKGDQAHLVAVVELCYGLAQHLLAYGLETEFGEHRDTHQGLPAMLRQHGQSEIAMLFERLGTLRHGRWYGGKGNGEVLDEALGIIAEIEGWALK